MEEDEADNPFFNNHIRKFFEQSEDYTVGQIFVDSEGTQALTKKEPLVEASNRNSALEQAYGKPADESAFKSSMGIDL